MKKVELCSALPGCCWSCGSSNREWYIDTERSIDYYGAVYFCNKCVEEWATIAGMTSADQTIQLESKIEHQENVIFDLTVQVSGLEQAVDGLRTAGSISRVNPLHPSVYPPSEPTGTVPEGEEPVGREGGETPEQGNDEGVGELHSTESPTDRSDFTLNL